jgi:hypothetical protein
MARYTADLAEPKVLLQPDGRYLMVARMGRIGIGFVLSVADHAGNIVAWSQFYRKPHIQSGQTSSIPARMTTIQLMVAALWPVLCGVFLCTRWRRNSGWSAH